MVSWHPTVPGRGPGRVGPRADIARAPRRGGQLRGLLPWDDARAALGGYRRVVGSERDMSYPAGDREPGAYPAYPGSAESSRSARPPLTKRMRPLHWIAIDCVVGGF